MTFYEFIAAMSDEEIEQYALKCATSVYYLRNHLKGARKVPRPKLMNALWEQSEGALTRQVVLDHFFPQGDGKSA